MTPIPKSSQASEMAADLREIITFEEAAQIHIIFAGRPIIGTRGNLLMSASYDQDDGGIYSDDNVVGTFLLSDFPSQPTTQEIVQVNGRGRLRILRLQRDDLSVAIALTFTSQNEA